MIATELLQILALPRAARTVFLQRELGKLGGILRVAARLYRRLVIADTRLVAVVGSLGKTSTQRALHAALDCPDRDFSFNNYGAQLALNVLRIRRGDRHAVIEAGISAPGYMEGYARFLQPDIVVATSIGSEHCRSFPTLDDTRNEKVKMVRALRPSGLAVLNGDDPRIRWMATQTRARVLTYGMGEDNDVRATNLEDTANGLRFDVALASGVFEVRSRLLGRHMAYPCLAAIAVADRLGLPLTGVLPRLAALAPANSRMVPLRLPNGALVVDDSFKNTFETIPAALHALRGIPARRRIVVLDSVEDPPGSQGAINRELGRLLAQNADRLICLGRGMSGIRTGAVAAGLPRDAVQLLGDDLDAVSARLLEELRPDDVILIKGRSTRPLRRLVLRLLQQPVRCRARYCIVKVPSCDACPLLNAPREMSGNRFVARYLRHRSAAPECAVRSPAKDPGAIHYRQERCQP